MRLSHRSKPFDSDDFIYELKIDGFRPLAHLEGIVCKRKDSRYKVTEKPSRHWIKVKNPRYSQLEGRQELFEGRPAKR